VYSFISVGSGVFSSFILFIFIPFSAQSIKISSVCFNFIFSIFSSFISIFSNLEKSISFQFSSNIFSSSILQLEYSSSFISFSFSSLSKLFISTHFSAQSIKKSSTSFSSQILFIFIFSLPSYSKIVPELVLISGILSHLKNFHSIFSQISFSSKLFIFTLFLSIFHFSLKYCILSISV
jgi:hypothetical protein